MVSRRFGPLLRSASAFSLLAIVTEPAFAQQTVESQQNLAEQKAPPPQTAQPQPDAADAQSGDNSTIVVTGRRSSIEAAAQIERDSNVLKSVVTADDVGQFGDPTVAESLQRISGVSINRENGQGEQVSIRGLPSEFSTVTIDGARLGTTDPGISSSKLDFFSADNLSEIEVTKALTPEQDGDAIAGSVNLKTNSAFRRGRDSYGGRVEMGYNERRGSWNPKVSGDFTKIVDLASGNRLGFAGSVTWSRDKLFNDDARVDDGLEFVVNNGSLDDPSFRVRDDCSGADVVECFLRPKQFDFRGEFREVDRLSLNGTVEAEIGSTLLEFRGTYAKADTSRYTDRQTFYMERSDKSEIISMGPDFGEIIDARTERRLLPSDIKNDVYTLGADGTTNAGDWRFTYGGYYASNNETSEALEGRFRADDVRLIYENLDASGVDVTLALQDDDEDDPLDPASYKLNSNQINERTGNSKDSNWSIYSNAERLLSMFGNEAALKVGAKYRQRKRDYDFDRNEISVDPLSLADFDELDDRLGLSDLPILFDPNRAELTERLKELAASGEILGDAQLDFAGLASVQDDYTAKEDIAAAYAQFTVHPTSELQIIGGVRVESTNFRSKGSRIRQLQFNEAATDVVTSALEAGGASGATVDSFVTSRLPFLPVEALEGGNKYTNILPSVNIKWQPTRAWVVRASYARGLKRPEYREAAAVQEFVTNEDGLDEDILADIIASDFGGQLTSIDQANAAIAAAVAAGGDPQFETEGVLIRDPTLDPLTADNFDVSAAWYPSRNTTFSVAAFYKRIKNFIVPVGLGGADVQEFGFPPDEGTANSLGVSRINTFINGESATIYGLEIGFYQAFRFLPHPLDGFFVDGNVTFAKSKAKAPIVERSFKFPDQSGTIGNLSVGWENRFFSFRVAGIYQGPRLRELNKGQLHDSNDPAGDFYEAKRTQLDVSVRYNFTKDIQLYFDAINITGAGDRRFYLGDNHALTGSIFGRNERYGSTYQGGLRVRF